jgi:hypothetical protein
LFPPKDVGKVKPVDLQPTKDVVAIMAATKVDLRKLIPDVRNALFFMSLIHPVG